MQEIRLLLAGAFTMLTLAGGYIAMPVSTADPSDPFASVSSGASLQKAQAYTVVAAQLHALNTRRYPTEGMDPKSLSSDAQKLRRECLGPLSRRGMRTEKGSEADEACTCVGYVLAEDLRSSRDARKLAGYFFDPLFERQRNNKQVYKRFEKRAKRLTRRKSSPVSKMTVFRAVNRAVKSSCRLRSRLRIRLGIISPSLHM